MYRNPAEGPWLDPDSLCIEGHMRIFVRFFLFSLLLTSIFAVAADQPKSLELSRAVRPWEFMCSVGQRAAVFGHEDGDFETWVYPVKLLRNFHLNFFIAGRQIPGSSIARTIVVRPESTTIVYVYDQF